MASSYPSLSSRSFHAMRMPCMARPAIRQGCERMASALGRPHPIPASHPTPHTMPPQHASALGRHAAGLHFASRYQPAFVTLPPPPAEALIMTGKPMSRATAIAWSTSSVTPAHPGMVLTCVCVCACKWVGRQDGGVHEGDRRAQEAPRASLRLCAGMHHPCGPGIALRAAAEPSSPPWPTMAAAANFLLSTLSPIFSMAKVGGPTHVAPADSTALANTGFSLKKPGGGGGGGGRSGRSAAWARTRARGGRQPHQPPHRSVVASAGAWDKLRVPRNPKAVCYSQNAAGQALAETCSHAHGP